jgi:hypothetical protein
LPSRGGDFLGKRHLPIELVSDGREIGIFTSPNKLVDGHEHDPSMDGDLWYSPLGHGDHAAMSAVSVETVLDATLTSIIPAIP